MFNLVTEYVAHHLYKKFIFFGSYKPPYYFGGFTDRNFCWIDADSIVQINFFLVRLFSMRNDMIPQIGTVLSYSLFPGKQISTD